MLDYVICVHHIFIVSGTSMYFSFYLQWDVGSSPSVERWCILLSSSSVVRRCISPSTSSGTLVVHLQWNVGVFCYLHRQWYVDVFLFHAFSGTLVYFVIFIVSGTSMNHIFLYHQWYGGMFLHAFSGTWVCVIVSGTAVRL